MYHNRLARSVHKEPKPVSSDALSQTSQPSPFWLCSPTFFTALTQEQWLTMQVVYQLAFEEAQAVVRPSLLERDLLGVWN